MALCWDPAWPMKSWLRSARAAWAKCTSLTIRGWGVTWLSRLPPNVSGSLLPRGTRGGGAEPSHICQLYDVGPDYLVMELCEGETLADRLKRGKLSMQEAIRYGAQIADACRPLTPKGLCTGI